MMNIIILSKDRPMQLDLLLRSLKWFFIGFQMAWVKIIFTYSNQRYKEGYVRVMDKYQDVHFSEETDFKNNVMSALDRESRFMMFLTDDMVFQRFFSLDDIQFELLSIQNDICCISLVLGENITWAYEKEREIKKPYFMHDMTWEWKTSDIDFNYPMSVCGHVFLVDDIAPRIDNLGYDKAWNLESEMARSPILKPRMICYKKSVAVEMCNNRVSPVNNKFGGENAEEYNNRWMDGWQIKLEQYDNNSIHFSRKFNYERMV